MSIESTLPYSWLRTLSPDIKSLDTIPLWGAPPPFPWETYASALGKALQIQNFRLKPGDMRWLPQADLSWGLGENPHVIALQIPPLEGSLYWLLPQEDLKGLLRLTVGSNEKLSELEELGWSEEFYHFLSTEALLALQKVKFDSKLNPQITTEKSLPNSACLAVDVEIAANTQTFHGRLLFTPTLRASISQNYSAKSMVYPAGFAAAVNVDVQLIAGSTTLSPDEWKSVTPGDFLLLDSCSLTLEKDKGRILLVVYGSPIFRGKIKDGNVKLLEYPLLQEVQTPMAKYEDTFEDEEFEEEESEIEEEIPDEESIEEEEEEIAEQSVNEEEEVSIQEEETAIPPPEASSTTPLQKAFAKPQEIPLTLSVEVGRVVMSLKQLMELSPGNVLELNVHPENGVDLVVNGRCVGKGELLKIGDVLGVRILDKA